MNTVLSTQNLTKKFGKITAVSAMNLAISENCVFGLLGPNGSGKTTTLGMVLDIIRPTDGDFQWFGSKPDKFTRKKIGSTLESPAFYPYLTGAGNLKISCTLKGVDYSEIHRVLRLVNLDQRAHDKFRTYSFGMKQRLAIAAALLGNPKALILDEPTNGLDPQGISEIRQLVNRVAGEGVSIIFASHILDEVQKVCTHVAIMRLGKILYSGKVDEVLAETGGIEISSSNLEIMASALKDCPFLLTFRREGIKFILTPKPDADIHEIHEYLISNGIVLHHLVERKRSLEDQYLELLKNNQ